MPQWLESLTGNRWIACLARVLTPSRHMLFHFTLKYWNGDIEMAQNKYW